MSGIDFAELVLSTKTDGLKRGERALDSLADEGERTEHRTKKSTGAIGRSYSVMGGSIAKAAGGAVLALVSFQKASQGVQQARGFSAAMAETSTLIEGNRAEMDLLSKSARGMAKEFGTSATDQVDAFYSAISGGADGVAGATDLLDTSNRLAIGGITDVTTATGILNAAMNVYKSEGLTAIEVSDALFVAMAGGETKIGLLAASLGKVLPQAKAVGMSFDEVAATTAALTKGGISTAEAVTGIKASLLAVIRPTQDALDLAEDLNVEFSVGALKAEGYAGFMEKLAVATGGSAEQLATLFSSSEAGSVAMTLAGDAGVTLGNILVDMANKTGAAEEAFQKIANGFDHRWKKAASAAADVALRFGNVALTVVVPALEVTAGMITLVADNSDFLIAAFGVLAVKSIPATVAGLITMTGWLATSEGLFISGAIAARGMSIAMNAIPFVAAATAATAVYRIFRDNRQAAADYTKELKDLTVAQDALTTATAAFYEEASQASLDAMRIASERNLEAVKEALAASRKELEAASFSTNFFGANFYETDRMAKAKASINELEGAYFEAEARISAVGHSQSNFNSKLKQAEPPAAKATELLKALTTASDDLGGSFGAGGALPEGLGYLADQIDTLTAAQKQLAEFSTAGAIQNTIGEASKLAGQLGISPDSAELFKGLIDNVSVDDPFAQQAKSLGEIVQYLDAASGGVENMNTAALGVYESLLKSLDAALGLSKIDTMSVGEGKLAGIAGDDIAQMERRREMLGKTNAEVAALTLKYKLLDEVKASGLGLDDKTSTGETVREGIEKQVAAMLGVAQKLDNETTQNDAQSELDKLMGRDAVKRNKSKRDGQFKEISLRRFSVFQGPSASKPQRQDVHDTGVARRIDELTEILRNTPRSTAILAR